MTRYPVLVPTSHGTLGGVVHEPDGDPVASVVFLAGGTGRAGPNRVWVRLADSLAANGLIAFRVDDRDVEIASQRTDYPVRIAAGIEAIDWFWREVGDLDVLLCGVCLGTRICLTFAAAHDGIAGVGLVAPRFSGGATSVDGLPRSGGFATALKRTARRVKQLAPSLSEHVPPAMVRQHDNGQFDPEFETVMSGFDRSRSVWILLGERDRRWRSLWTPETRPPELAAAEVEIVPDVELRTMRTLRSQHIAIDRVTAWALRMVSEPTLV